MHEERILVWSAVGIVKIDFKIDKPFAENGSLWVNLVTREILNLEHIPHYYPDGDSFSPDYYCEIWIPVCKK